MADILFIKTSSLGDVIHHMPALTEAREARARTRVSPGWWRRPLRRWCACIRRSARSFRWPGGAGASRSTRRQRWPRLPAACAPSGRGATTKSWTARACCARAVIARARAWAAPRLRHRTASASRWPSPFYDVRHRVSRDLHAVERNRILSGLALGYAPQGAPDFGLDRARLASAGRALCRAAARHGAAGQSNGRRRIGSRSAKRSARKGSISCCRGAREPSARAAKRIAAALPRARVPERAPLDAVARLIAGAQFVVGVDTGLLHLAAALGVPLVAIFAGSKPGSDRSGRQRADRGARRARRRRRRSRR